MSLKALCGINTAVDIVGLVRNQCVTSVNFIAAPTDSVGIIHLEV